MSSAGSRLSVSDREECVVEQQYVDQVGEKRFDAAPALTHRRWSGDQRPSPNDQGATAAIRTILVGASGGSASNGAIELACRFANRLHAHVEGFHVLLDPVAVFGPWAWATAWPFPVMSSRR